ncbi:MAG TPA: hypothetical protein VNI35_08445 [Nitrospira sp.]|nr:hypothetical protein [Nitrospira sp.]
MIFSGKPQGFFVEINEFNALVARTSSNQPPFKVEAVKDVPGASLDAIGEALLELADGKKRGRLMSASFAIYPQRRFIRKATIDGKKLKDEAYLNELLVSQFRVEPEKMTLALISCATGGAVDGANSNPKEGLFCGSFTDDFKKMQADLLAAGLYPESIELGSIAMLGALLSYLAFTESKTPTLFLEVGKETTNCYILNVNGVDLARPIALGVNSIIPLVQKELGLKDEESAAKLFFSNTFDFGGMGPALIKKLLKELQSSIGFYEVQTGQSIGQLVCSGLPDNLAWLGTTLGSTLGVNVLKPDLGPWLKTNGIEWNEANVGVALGQGHFGLMSLAGRFQTGQKQDEKE